MKIAYFGSGAFGLPTLELLLREHRILLGITQPDRPAGRGRVPAATPVAEALARAGVPTIKPVDVNAGPVLGELRSLDVDAFVVIAFGQKIGPALLQDRFAINLHGSILPRHRGASPVNASILAGDSEAGVSVITLAQRMDAGEILAVRSTPIDPLETAGELHDRLALLGPAAVAEVLAARAAGTLRPRRQDEGLATRAPKLSRSDCWLRFEDPATQVQRRVHGLSPWPGCAVTIAGVEVRLLRVAVVDAEGQALPGRIQVQGAIRCGRGAILPIDVQPAGGRPMPYEAFLRGHRPELGEEVRSVVPAPTREGGRS